MFMCFKEQGALNKHATVCQTLRTGIMFSPGYAAYARKKKKPNYASVMLVKTPACLQKGEHKGYIHGIKLYQVPGTWCMDIGR